MMKHNFLKLTALILALTMILPLALLGCSDAIFNENVTNAIANNQTNNTTGSTPPEKTTQAIAALDLTAEWDKINGANTLVQGCLVINRSFAANHPNEVAKFLADYQHSVNTVKAGDDNAANLVFNAGILPQLPLAKKALPGCNLCYFAGSEMKPMMNTFCEKMLAVAPASIGNQLPDDGFYYTASGDAAAANSSKEIKIYALNGTTALGMAEMIVNSANGTDDMNYNISLHTDPQAVAAAVKTGDCAIAALPTNAAANLYNKSGDIQLLALNTRGVLYLLQSAGYSKISSLGDLKGKTIYLPGTGSNPEFITVALLQSAGLVIGSDVMLDATTYSTPDALQSAFAAGLVELAVLPEPKVTVALTQANTKK